MMKHYAKYILVTVLCLTLVGCKKNEDPTNAVLTVNQTNAFLPDAPSGSTTIISFHTNMDWNATLEGDRADDYFELSTTSGGSGDGYITVRTRSVNATYDDLLATLRINVGDMSATVALVQRRKGSVVLDNKQVSVPQAGGDFAVTMKTNLDYAIEISPSTPWVKQNTTKGISEHQLSFSVEPNTDYSDRKAEIVIRDKDTEMKDTIYVTQYQTNGVILSSRNILVGEQGETVPVTLSSNVDYDVVMPAADWVTRAEGTKALVDTPYAFDVKPNTGFEKRVAMVIFKHRTSALADTLTITQMQKGAVMFDRKNFNVDVNGAVITVGYLASVVLNTRSNRAWIYAAETKAMERRAVEFTIEENTADENREGWIVFENTSVGVRDTVYIFQRGVAQAARADSMALLDMFKATGRAWTNNLNWGTSQPLSKWYGVTVNQFTRRVTEIRMSNNNMQGELPESFTNLTALSSIDFSNNGLRGTLPDAISDLSNLEGLNLGDNSMEGNIPVGVAGMPKLRQFILKNNKMSGDIPTAIFSHKFWLTWKPTVNIAPGNNFANINNYADFNRELTANVLLHRTAKVLNVRVTPEVFAEWNAGAENFKPLAREVYGAMKDNFDMIFFVMANPAGATFGASEVNYYSIVRNTIKGLGLPQSDNAADYGSTGKLQYVMMLDAVDAVGKPTVLHRMLHRWGNYALPTRAIDGSGGEVDARPHWGVSDACGLLGGFSPTNLTTNVDGNPQKYRGLFSASSNGFSQTQNEIETLSPIELYLLGMEDKSLVTSVTLYAGLSWVSQTNFATGIFMATGSTRYTIADVVKANGERIPGYSGSQKKFKILTVIVSSGAVSNEEASLVISDMEMFVGEKGGRPTPTFAKATKSRGSLLAGDLTEDIR